MEAETVSGACEGRHRASGFRQGTDALNAAIAADIEHAPGEPRALGRQIDHGIHHLDV